MPPVDPMLAKSPGQRYEPKWDGFFYWASVGLAGGCSGTGWQAAIGRPAPGVTQPIPRHREGCLRPNLSVWGAG